MPRSKGRKVTEFVAAQVAMPLNEAEQRVKAIDLARLCSEIDKLRADARDHAGTERKKIRALEEERRLLADCVRTGNEMRDAQLEFSTAPKSAKKWETSQTPNGSVTRPVDQATPGAPPPADAAADQGDDFDKAAAIAPANPLEPPLLDPAAAPSSEIAEGGDVTRDEPIRPRRPRARNGKLAAAH